MTREEWTDFLRGMKGAADGRREEGEEGKLEGRSGVLEIVSAEGGDGVAEAGAEEPMTREEWTDFLRKMKEAADGRRGGGEEGEREQRSGRLEMESAEGGDGGDENEEGGGEAGEGAAGVMSWERYLMEEQAAFRLRKEERDGGRAEEGWAVEGKQLPTWRVMEWGERQCRQYLQVVGLRDDGMGLGQQRKLCCGVMRRNRIWREVARKEDKGEGGRGRGRGRGRCKGGGRGRGRQQERAQATAKKWEKEGGTLPRARRSKGERMIAELELGMKK